MKTQLKQNSYLLLAGLLTLIFNACVEEEDKDLTEPEITMIAPLSCDTIYRGVEYLVSALLEDNEELGSYGIDIHHNFDHHGHATEVEPCPLDDKKDPINVYNYKESFTLETGLKQFTIQLPITIPDSYEPGDYHLQFTVVDKTGWQSYKIISIKIL